MRDISSFSDRINPDTGRPFVVHNIGAGPKLDDMLFSYTITGHYRYAPLVGIRRQLLGCWSVTIGVKIIILVAVRLQQ